MSAMPGVLGFADAHPILRSTTVTATSGATAPRTTAPGATTSTTRAAPTGAATTRTAASAVTGSPAASRPGARAAAPSESGSAHAARGARSGRSRSRSITGSGGRGNTAGVLRSLRPVSTAIEHRAAPFRQRWRRRRDDHGVEGERILTQPVGACPVQGVVVERPAIHHDMAPSGLDATGQHGGRPAGQPGAVRPPPPDHLHPLPVQQSLLTQHRSLSDVPAASPKEWGLSLDAACPWCQHTLHIACYYY